MQIFNREIFIPRVLRNALALLLSFWMAHSGYRFSKDFRWNTTLFHGFVYGCINTTQANRLADTQAPPSYLQ